MLNMLDYLDVFMLAFARLGGMIFVNPLFSRRNIPMRARVGFVFALAFVLAPNLDGQVAAGYNGLETAGALMREIALGVSFGLVFQIFFYMLFAAGDLMDTVFGLSMAKVFDPINGLQTTITGQLLQIIFVLYFFATGSHLVMIKLFAYSFEVIPVGGYTLLIGEVGSFLLSLFESSFVLVLKLTLPFVAAEFLVEGTMGILMKLIPQIHIFMINMQIKIMVGLALLLLFAQPIGDFVENYLGILMENMQKLLTLSA